MFVRRLVHTHTSNPLRSSSGVRHHSRLIRLVHTHRHSISIHTRRVLQVHIPLPTRTAKLPRIAHTRHIARPRRLHLRRAPKRRIADAGPSLNTSDAIALRDAVTHAGLDARAHAIGVGRGVQYGRGAAVAALREVVADLLDRRGGDSRRGGVPDAEVLVAAGVVAAADLGGVSRAGGSAGLESDGRVGLQTVAAVACLAVLGGGDAVIVLVAEGLAELVGHGVGGCLGHADEGEGGGLVGAAEVDVGADGLAGGGD